MLYMDRKAWEYWKLKIYWTQVVTENRGDAQCFKHVWHSLFYFCWSSKGPGFVENERFEFVSVVVTPETKKGV